MCFIDSGLCLFSNKTFIFHLHLLRGFLGWQGILFLILFQHLPCAVPLGS